MFVGCEGILFSVKIFENLGAGVENLWDVADYEIPPIVCSQTSPFSTTNPLLF